jgi:hypothetical protein
MSLVMDNSGREMGFFPIVLLGSEQKRLKEKKEEEKVLSGVSSKVGDIGVAYIWENQS